MMNKGITINLAPLAAILIVLMGVISGCSEGTEEIIEAEITRTGKYSMDTSIYNDDKTIDIIDLDNGVEVKQLEITTKNFYSLRVGDIINVRRVEVSDNKLRYMYVEADNIKDIGMIAESDRTEITSVEMDVKVTAKKTYTVGSEESVAHIKLAYIQDRELNKIIPLYRLESIWGLLNVGEDVRVQRDSMEYGGETYYHYYILYEKESNN